MRRLLSLLFAAMTSLGLPCDRTLQTAFAEEPTVVSAASDPERSGAGWRESIDGYPVVHLKGTPYEIGFQQGQLLKTSVRKNLKNLLEVKGGKALVEVGPLKLTPRAAIDMIVSIQKPYVPQRYFDEMRGLADGAGVSFNDVRAANFIPELFHCSGFALMGSATADGEILHGRVLDYAVDWGLQEHAVILVVESEGRIPWVNVTYAGFIGSVTGMNRERISLGEMGGGGLGHWSGVPMAMLMREALETAESLDDVIRTFRESPRTCQYYYVAADGETRRAAGMEASWDVFGVVEPGAAHPLLPKPVPDCVLLSAGDRYEELVRRAQAGLGRFTPERALTLMERPVAMNSNLHNVLFAPGTLKFWVANAGIDRQPAAERPYHAFDLNDLLRRSPAPSSAAPVANTSTQSP